MSVFILLTANLGVLFKVKRSMGARGEAGNLQNGLTTEATIRLNLPLESTIRFYH